MWIFTKFALIKATRRECILFSRVTWRVRAKNAETPRSSSFITTPMDPADGLYATEPLDIISVVPTINCSATRNSQVLRNGGFCTWLRIHRWVVNTVFVIYCIAQGKFDTNSMQITCNGTCITPLTCRTVNVSVALRYSWWNHAVSPATDMFYTRKSRKNLVIPRWQF